MSDNLIIDRFYLEYEVYNFGFWERHCCFVRSFEVDANDASMLTVVTAASGKTLHFNPIRNLVVRECGGV